MRFDDINDELRKIRDHARRARGHVMQRRTFFAVYAHEFEHAIAYPPPRVVSRHRYRWQAELASWWRWVRRPFPDDASWVKAEDVLEMVIPKATARSRVRRSP